ncbi:hypothetical protein [Qipengyuania sp. 902]|uniref:hypothetical protein n=1 Tax=Qipengyuania sp. 902 TaxID=3417565 RepID=UPI003EBD9AA8
MTAGITQDALDRLFTAALEAAVARMEKDGHFFPLVFEMRANGMIHNVAMLETAPVDGSADVLGRLTAMLRTRADEGTIVASAIVLQGGDDQRMSVRLRAQNYAKNIFVPFEIERKGFVKRRRRVSLGDISGDTVPNDVF